MDSPGRKGLDLFRLWLLLATQPHDRPPSTSFWNWPKQAASLPLDSHAALVTFAVCLIFLVRRVVKGCSRRATCWTVTPRRPRRSTVPKVFPSPCSIRRGESRRLGKSPYL